MKVYAYPADPFGCGHYRIVWPAECVARLGVEVTLIPPHTPTGIRGTAISLTGDSDDTHLFGVSCPPDADVLVVQRPTNRLFADAIEALADQVAVVVDMDDDLATIHPRNPAWLGLHPRYSPEDNWTHAARACRAAALVTVSTPALAERYGSHGRVVVLENQVPESYLQVAHHDSGSDEPLVGWPGSAHSHPADLQTVGSGVAQAGLPFRVVGPPEDVGEALRIGPVDGTGNVSFGSWAAAVATLDVGLCPLEDSRFNAAKSWLKPLEMSAVGVPWVGSPRAEYRRLHEEGCGLLADRPRDWARALKRLKDRNLRSDLSGSGREVAARHTYQGNAWRWAEAWKAAAA